MASFVFSGSDGAKFIDEEVNFKINKFAAHCKLFF